MTTPIPPFWTTLKSAFAAGVSAFVLHNNTEDHASFGITLRGYIAAALADRTACFYNRTTGFEFPLPSQEQAARKILALDAPVPAPTTGAMALLMGSTPQPQRQEFPNNPSAALPLIDRLLSSTERTAVIITHAETLAPASELGMMSPGDRDTLVQLLEWARKDRTVNGEQPDALLILVARNLQDLHPALREAYKAIEIPLPDYQARLEYITAYFQNRPLQSDIQSQELAAQTAGLSLVQIEDLLLEAEVKGRLTADQAKALKDDKIRAEYAGLVEVLNPDYGFDAVGGMERLKAWAASNIIKPIRQGRLQDCPKGVILVGPPGTGKTYFITALAREIGFNAVAIQMDKILGGIVGQSERNLARVIDLVRSLAPVLVFMDEIDQSDVSARGNTSGNPVAKNLFSQVLQFLGDERNRGQVLFFAASNRPDLIDPALLRFGRTDAIIPILLPNATERAAIAAAQARRQGATINDQALQAIVAGSEQYSAADLAAIVTKARRLGNGTITPDTARQALRTIRPTTTSTAQYYTLLAVQAVNDLDLLPEEYTALLEDRKALEQAIDQVQPRKAGRTL